MCDSPKDTGVTVLVDELTLILASSFLPTPCVCYQRLGSLCVLNVALLMNFLLATPPVTVSGQLNLNGFLK